MTTVIHLNGIKTVVHSSRYQENEKINFLKRSGWIDGPIQEKILRASWAAAHSKAHLLEHDRICSMARFLNFCGDTPAKGRERAVEYLVSEACNPAFVDEILAMPDATLDKLKIEMQEAGKAEIASFAPIAAQPTSPYNNNRIAWELQQTAMGNSYFGSALLAAQSFKDLTTDESNALLRYINGSQNSTDHISLQGIAIKVMRDQSFSGQKQVPTSSEQGLLNPGLMNVDKFTVRLVSKGDRYGLDHCLAHDKDEPLVEFYDARYPFTEFGQFVARYDISTILDGDDAGINLDGGVPEWTISADDMAAVRAWLEPLAGNRSAWEPKFDLFPPRMRG